MAPMATWHVSIHCRVIMSMLVQGKESGESITIQGQKVALGIPGGEVAAEMTADSAVPLKRVGTVADAAGAMLFLASPLANYVSGQSLEVTGGQFL